MNEVVPKVSVEFQYLKDVYHVKVHFSFPKQLPESPCHMFIYTFTHLVNFTVLKSAPLLTQLSDKFQPEASVMCKCRLVQDRLELYKANS